ncbi:major facilitator superfamily domain-containing protein [Mycena sp. CBHHK59/15]|nr:major facilitator superfamily domain-containing protein [Mycena sp. CBHHK59/15]
MTGENSASSTLRPSPSLCQENTLVTHEKPVETSVHFVPNAEGSNWDNTIIATAMNTRGVVTNLFLQPKITDQFDSLDDVGWYLLTTASFQLMFGKFYSFLSIKWVYITAISIFELGSFVCGIAPASKALIIGRAIAGVGSAGIFSGALIIVANVVPLRNRPLYTGLVGSMYGIASVAGPLMGGALTDKVSWRWCFYINLPIGAVTLLVMFSFSKTPPGIGRGETTSFGKRVEKFDPWGTMIFIPAVVCLPLALQWGGSKYPWNSSRIITLLVLSGVLGLTFIGVQIWAQDNATISPRILKQRSILAGAWYSFFAGSGHYILLYFLPIWFQAIKGVSAVKSGIENLAMVLSLVVAKLIAGTLVTVLGYYVPFMILGSIIMPIGAGLISTLTVDAGRAKWLGYQVVFGFGAGLGMQQPFIAEQIVLDTNDVPPGTSLLVFLQTLGGALFVSVAQNIFTNKLASGLVSQVPGLDPRSVLSAGATNLKVAINPKYLPAVLEVYNQALVSTFLIAIAMVCFSIFGALTIEWKNIKGKSVEMAAG